jgi:hypothetical protein
MNTTVTQRLGQTARVVVALAVVLSVLGPVGTVAAQEVSVTQSTTSTTAQPGETVTLQTTISGTGINGQGLQMFLPTDWTGSITDADGGAPKPTSGTANVLEVVWLSNGAYTVTYEVSVPADATAGDYTVDVEGSGINPETDDRVVTSTATTITVEEPQQNAAPTADAGADQTVDEGTTVQLDASGSSDPDGDTLSYDWTQTAGPDVALSDTTAESPSFTAPDVSTDQTLAFQVEVADGNGGTDTDTVTVTVQDVSEPNQAPTANAGPDQTVDEAATVVLDGSASSDPDGDTLSYDWSQTAGPDVTLSDTTAESPSFPAPEVTGETTLSFELTVSDGDLSDTDTVTVTVQDVPENAAPTADAGADQTVDEGTSVSLDGTGSSDPDGDSLSYDWTQTAGTAVSLQDTATATPSFTASEVDADETLTFELTVSDGDLSDTDTVTVTVQDVPEAPTGPTTTVGMSPASAEVVVGGTETYDLVLDSADGGVGAFTATVALDDPTAANITGVTIADDPGLSDATYAPDNSSVTINAALMNTADTGSVVIASVTVEGASEGSSDLTVDVSALGNEAGESYTITDQSGATVSVVALQPLGDFEDPPGDLDDDGLYEDTNGDGTFNIVDVQALFANTDDPTAENNPGKFDHNGDGEFDIVDVQALYDELIS